VEVCGCGEFLSKAWVIKLRICWITEVVSVVQQGKCLHDAHDAGFDNLSWEHVRRPASFVGVHVKRLTRQEMTSRMEFLHKHCDTIEDLQAATNTYPWFRKGGRVKVEADSLGSFVWKLIPWTSGKP
jgi:hypothetical protein